MKIVTSSSREVSASPTSVALGWDLGTWLGSGHLAEDTTSDVRCLTGDENTRSAQRYFLDLMRKHLDGGSHTQIPQESPGRHFTPDGLYGGASVFPTR